MSGVFSTADQIHFAGKCIKNGLVLSSAFLSKLPHIQLLRAFAALSVAMLHAQHDAGALAARSGRAFASLERFPWAAGVDVFFVISGFIMVHASRGLFGGSEARAIFLRRRIARIVPLYWAVTTLYLAVAVIAPQLLNSELLAPWPILASYLFIPFERPDGLVQPLYSLGWTLNYEMFFYGLFALTLAWPRRRAVLACFCILLGLVAVGRLVRLPEPLAFWTAPIMLEFAFGLGLGLMRAEGMSLSRPVRYGLAACGLVLFAWNPVTPDAAAVLPRAVGWGIPAAFLVAAAALGEERREERLDAPGWMTRFGAEVGDASYALYLIHPFAIRAGSELVVRTGMAQAIGPWSYVGLVLGGAVLASLLVHRWFERPVTNWARRWLEPVKSPQWQSP